MISLLVFLAGLAVLFGLVFLADEFLWRVWPIRPCKRCGKWFYLGEYHRCGRKRWPS